MSNFTELVNEIEKRWPGASFSVSKLTPFKKRRLKKGEVDKPYEAYISNNMDIGEPGHFFVMTDGETPEQALEFALSQLIHVEACAAVTAAQAKQQKNRHG